MQVLGLERELGRLQEAGAKLQPLPLTSQPSPHQPAITTPGRGSRLCSGPTARAPGSPASGLARAHVAHEEAWLLPGENRSVGESGKRQTMHGSVRLRFAGSDFFFLIITADLLKYMKMCF